MKSPLPLLLAGGALLVMKSKSSKKAATGDEKSWEGPTPVTNTHQDGTVSGGAPVPDAPASGASDAEIDAIMTLPPFKASNEVVFNAALSEFAVGASWRYATLDKWLNVRRLDGWLETKSNEAPSYYASSDQRSQESFLEEALSGLRDVAATGLGATLGLSAMSLLFLKGILVASPIGTAAVVTTAALGYAGAKYFDHDMSAEKESYIKQTGALALLRFTETNYVLVGPNRSKVLIADLVRTKAVTDFLGVVGAYIVRFQASTYS